MFWTVSVAAGETVTVSYTVKVSLVAEYGKTVYGTDATVGGVSFKCAELFIERTLTSSEEAAIVEATKQLLDEGTTLSPLAIVNEIYKRALGIEKAFDDTDIDTVVIGEEGAFKHISGHVHNLRPGTKYNKMLVPHLYGGYNFKNIDQSYVGDRTRLLTEDNLQIGDVIISKTSTTQRIYIYIGGDRLVNIIDGISYDSVTVSQRCTYVLAYYKYYGVFRPSFLFKE